MSNKESKKKYLILIGIILIVFIILLLLYLLIPKIDIKLNGDSTVTINYGDSYVELGANAYVKNAFSKQNIPFLEHGVVDTTKLGSYKLVYEANYKKLHNETSRKIIVVDKEKPKIILEDDVKLCKNNNSVELNVKAIDNYDGDITSSIKYKIIDNYISIISEDSSNNISELKAEVKYIDDEKPIISLKGDKALDIQVNDEYIEYGAVAEDSCDGDLTDNIVIEGKVDVFTPGTYSVSYKVKDSVGNETVVKREVNVVSAEEIIPDYKVIKGATVYLTFDDGPGAYTEEILNILDKYKVKATFFVTNQMGNKYQYLIKKEYEKGHTIGIHTYSHKWSIYSSVDDYLNDFNKMKDIIVEQTGVEPTIFRFPGGSSNTVSRKYCKGIMTDLARIMTEKGYTYYDWTFDSGDTNKKHNSVNDILNNVKRNLKGDGAYIVLMHDIKKNTKEALPKVIEYAKSKNYSFAAITSGTPAPHLKIAN